MARWPTSAAITAWVPSDSEESRTSEGFVVGEVGGLLLGAEGVGLMVYGQYQVGLLVHLLSLQVEVREVQQQGGTALP